MWLWCNVSTVMRMGWGQGRIFGCRSSLRPARGGMERCACNTRGQSRRRPRRDPGVRQLRDRARAASEMLTPPRRLADGQLHGESEVNLPVSRSTSAVEENFSKCPQDDFDIQPERPVFDVKVVVSGAVGDRGVSPQPTDLSESGQSGLYAVTVGISVELRGEQLYEVRPLWSRPDQRHIAAKYVPQLR